MDRPGSEAVTALRLMIHRSAALPPNSGAGWQMTSLPWGLRNLPARTRTLSCSSLEAGSRAHEPGTGQALAPGLPVCGCSCGSQLRAAEHIRLDSNPVKGRSRTVRWPEHIVHSANGDTVRTLSELSVQSLVLKDIFRDNHHIFMRDTVRILPNSSLFPIGSHPKRGARPPSTTRLPVQMRLQRPRT